MPIVDVELVVRKDEALPEGLASRLADALGEALGTGPGRTWVRLRTLADTHYAENAAEAPRPVFVNVLLAALPPTEALRAQAAQVAAAVASACGCPADNVHVLFEPPARGRIAFGGTLRE